MKNIKCETSFSKTYSNSEDNYYSISIRNRKEGIDIEVKMTGEEFANFITGMVQQLPIRSKIE